MSIKVAGLRKSFGNSIAVAGIDLFVPEGEMLVLLGPSGCGKTTTMRCIAGLEEPDEGTIEIGETSVYDRSAGIFVPVNERNVGMVFQSYAIWPHMSVFENIAFPLEMEGLGRDGIRKRVGDILDLVGLTGLEDRGASYLSGGQMQRVALARSLVMQPSVLLFDEPLSNLDARLRDHLRVQLREIQTQLKITSVYVTHDQREALALADQIVMMSAGEILQTGDPADLYNNPRSSEIAEFLGYSNIFDAGRQQSDDGTLVVSINAGGRTLRVSAIPEGSDEIAVCVRPDDISIRTSGSGVESTASANLINGDVILASFMGSFMQYRIRTGAQEIWEVMSPDVKNKLKLGDKAVLSIDPVNIKVLPKK